MKIYIIDGYIRDKRCGYRWDDYYSYYEHDGRSDAYLSREAAEAAIPELKARLMDELKETIGEEEVILEFERFDVLEFELRL